MGKPRIVIADSDMSYIIPLQLKFAEDYFEKIDLEIITEKNYCDQLFSSPQKVDILIVSEDMYDMSLQRHNIGDVFVMTEQHEEDSTAELNITRIFKYTSIKEILNEIVGKSAVLSNLTDGVKKESQIILVYSASGGAGKTTVAMGISACLAKNYKRVLYIDAECLQSFHRMFDNKSAITAAEVYAKLSNADERVYEDVKHVIRQESFWYLPPFKAALLSLGLKYSVYKEIAAGAKRSADYDYIIVDTDPSFDEEKASLIDIADKVIIVTKQSEASVFATNTLVSNMNGVSSEKYIFVCNDFNRECENALISPNVTMKFSVSDYVDHFPHYDQMKPGDLSMESSVQRTAFLIV